jgi:hypothetical protein
MQFRRSFIPAVYLLAISVAGAQNRELEDSYRFLVSDRDSSGGVLYQATAGELKRRALPLSYVDSAEYWGAYVCKHLDHLCVVTDIYNPYTYAMTSPHNAAGASQTERVMVHNGINIYDAATWQIAVVLGQVVNHFDIPGKQDGYALAGNQNKLLSVGYNGNETNPVNNANRGITKGSQFVYNSHVISQPDQAYAFRMLPRGWVVNDPFMGTSYESLITMSALIKEEPDYRRGQVTWTDWKPITGENAWAFLLGPLHAAYLHFISGEHGQYIPFDDSSVQQALAILPTFAAMQSPIGAVYYAPAGILGNQGEQLINPHQVSVENNVSLYAGLNVLAGTLRAELAFEKDLSKANKVKINAALEIIRIMMEGGQTAGNNATDGLLSFFKTHAWHNNEFVQGGLANDPEQKQNWVPTLKPHAIDTNTWGIAALGAKQIDQWFGFGTSYQNWQQVKRWSAYGVSNKLWGVGYSDEDGNGINPDGTYRQGVLSAEWTAGAITMVRSLIKHYGQVSTGSSEYNQARSYVDSLKQDEGAMLDGFQMLRIDNYSRARLPGKPDDYSRLVQYSTKPFLYASKRYFIPFGWNANPIPSTCSTAWAIMLADRFDPFGYAGQSN